MCCRIILVKLGMDRLNHHDRIIDYNSDSKKQSKQCEKINAESEQVQEEESTDNCHRNRYGRYKSGAEILQEKIDDNKDKNECLKKGPQNLFDRLIQKNIRIYKVFIMYPFGE